MTSDGLRTFEYDAAQRLAKVKVFKSGEAASVSYEYNAFGQRVFKSEYEAEQKLPRRADLGPGFINWLKARFGWLYTDARRDASIGTGYVYGDGQIPGWALLGEYDNGSASGAGRTEYIWLPVGNGDVIPVGMYRNGKLFAIHSDHLGTPRLMTDDSRVAVWQWPYSAFGNNKPTGVLKATAKPKQAVTTQAVMLEATPAVELNLRMPGQYSDVETGLFFNWNRYLDSGKGRYTQMDPIGLAGGWNRPGYAMQNPLSFTDPFGLDVFLCKQPAFGIPSNPIDHHWLKTDTAEAGMGGTRGNVPGNESGDMPGDPVQVVGHPNRSKESGASCSKIDGVDEKKVNDALKIGRSLGRWGPTNQCQSFARQTLLDAGWKQPRPPYGSNSLPPFGF